MGFATELKLVELQQILKDTLNTANLFLQLPTNTIFLLSLFILPHYFLRIICETERETGNRTD